MTKNDTENDGPVLLYEAGFLLVPTLSEQEASDEMISLTSFVEKKGAKIVESHNPQIKGLSYEMRTRGKDVIDRAYFLAFTFEAPSSVFLELESSLKSKQSIVRYSLVRLPKDALVQKERRVMGSIQKTKKIEKSEPISEAEIDKSIEELIK